MEFMKFAGKEMIDALDDNETVVAGESWNQRFDCFDGAVLVVASMHKQLGLVAPAQE